MPNIEDKCSRVIIYPNTEVAAKLVSEYKSRKITVTPIYRIVPLPLSKIPNPADMIHAIREWSLSKSGVTVFIGLDSYLTLLAYDERKDFFAGLHQIIDKQELTAHFIVSDRYLSEIKLKNPKYQGAMQLVRFAGQPSNTRDLSIRLFPQKWIGGKADADNISNALKKMGDYLPAGTFSFSLADSFLPSHSFDNVHVFTDAKQVLRHLFSYCADFDSSVATALLEECIQKGCSPIDIILGRLGGVKNLTPFEAPGRLNDLKDDPLWPAIASYVKETVDKDSYLRYVMDSPITATTFLQIYVVEAAVNSLNEPISKGYANERATVLRKLTTVEPLVAQFVTATENNDKAIPFLNCGFEVEVQGLLRKASRLDLSAGIPDIFTKANPMLQYYLSPNFDYGVKELTLYFDKLRRFRLKNDVSADFSQEAYLAKIPSGIRKRDQVLPIYDDGETALLVVDGLGAEYYPLLIHVAEQNNLNISSKEIVAVNLPSSTAFNQIPWSNEHVLDPVKRVDNITHEGHSKYEKCNYEENMAELFSLFQRVILARVIYGLNTHKRVIVTADHGASYLAVNAYKNGYSKTLNWNNPDDWRYASCNNAKNVSNDFVPIYRPSEEKTYYVVKGYNRLPKSGGKIYGLHGGATLEECLVPLIVFSQGSYKQEATQKVEEQFIEADEFDILF